MKYLGVVLGLSILAGQAFASSKAKARPHISSDVAGRLNGCPGNEPPCLDRDITVVNPGKSTIKVWLSCGDEILIDVHANVRGFSKARFVISSDTPILKGQCVLRYSVVGKR